MSFRRDVLQEEVASLKSEKAALESRLEVQQQAQEAMLKAEKEHAAKSLEEMRTAFKALSAENSEHFRKASAESVGELLKPIQEKFKEFSEHVKSSDEKNAERSGSMEKMIRILSEQSRSVGDQARALADAITGQSKTQGDFGEMLLVDLLRESGLQEGVNFDVQGCKGCCAMSRDTKSRAMKGAPSSPMSSSTIPTAGKSSWTPR